MRTHIDNGWVVAFEGGSHHVYERGSVVFDDDHIVHAGPRYTASADTRIDAAGRLVSPGFINTHVHTTGNGERVVRVTWEQAVARPSQTLARLRAAGVPRRKQPIFDPFRMTVPTRLEMGWRSHPHSIGCSIGDCFLSTTTFVF
jgi:formylmethanofuran dehydrogenase subunit A